METIVMAVDMSEFISFLVVIGLSLGMILMVRWLVMALVIQYPFCHIIQ